MKDGKRKTLESELHEENALINSTPDMIWAIDSEMRLISFNQSYKKAIESVLGKELKLYQSVLVKEFGAELNKKWKAHYQRALSGESFKITEEAEVGGKMTYGEISFHPITINGETIGVSCFNRDITALKENQIKLTVEKERLQLSLKSSKMGTFDFYPKENKVLWDERLFQIFEVSPSISIDLNQHFFSIIHPDDQEQVGKEFEKSLKRGGPSHHRNEYRVVIDGRVKHILAHSRMIRDDKGEVTRMLGTTQDITELRVSEEKLKKSEQLFRSIVQDQEEMIVRWKPGGVRTFANQAYCKKFNLKEEEVVGSSFFELIDDKDQEEVIKKLESLSPDNPTATKIHRVVLPDGSTGWQEWTDRVLYDDDGNGLEYQSTGRDITEIMEARKALEESEERYRNVFNQQFQFTALLDVNGKILDINDLALKAQGVFKDSFVGKFFWNAPGWEGQKELQKKVKSQIERLKNTGKPFTVEDEYLVPQGEIHYTTSHYSLIRNNQGDPENILVQAIDITEELRSKKLIEKSEQQLNTVYNNVSDLMALYRHDQKKFILESVNSAFIKANKKSGLDLEKDQLIGGELTENMRLFGFDEELIREKIANYEKAVTSKKPVEYLEITKLNGITIYGDSTLTPILGESGQVSYVLWTSRDITENYLGQKKLEEAYEQVNKLKSQLELENIYLKEEIKQEHDFENMVFRSKEFRKVLNKVEQVAKTDATVLITGETGTGKELIARAIHNVSKRSGKPMIKVNTAAIPRDLIESELFGHEKGAFTGAVGEKPGKFELAHGGSIFLDEIGDMPMDLQVKILRVLQEGEVERLGSNTTKKIDVRIISATNKNLEEGIKEGKFREDLYFRLNVFPVEIPPLRSRADDVPILVEHFIAKYNVKHSKRVNKIPKAVMDYLRNYTWPGNIRELENTVERAVILTSGETFDLQELVGSTSSQDQWEHDNSLDVIMENHIRQVLKDCRWKIEGEDGAAAQLKIKPSTLRDKMKKFKIKRPK